MPPEVNSDPAIGSVGSAWCDSFIAFVSVIKRIDQWQSTRKTEVVDFGAGAQLAIDPDAFIQVVREAFRLEHECLQNQDIADVLGVHKSR